MDEKKAKDLAKERQCVTIRMPKKKLRCISDAKEALEIFALGKCEFAEIDDELEPGHDIFYVRARKEFENKKDAEAWFKNLFTLPNGKYLLPENFFALSWDMVRAEDPDMDEDDIYVHFGTYFPFRFHR